MNGSKLALKDNSFELVFTCCVLMLNKNIDSILDEIIRVAKKWIIILEAKRKLRWAYKHPYEEIITSNGFQLLAKRSLKTSPKSKPLECLVFVKEDLINN